MLFCIIKHYYIIRLINLSLRGCNLKQTIVVEGTIQKRSIINQGGFDVIYLTFKQI